MKTILPCPVCGEQPDIQKCGERPDSYNCCEMAAYSHEMWNKYAAAVAFAEAAAWKIETDGTCYALLEQARPSVVHELAATQDAAYKSLMAARKDMLEMFS